MEQNITSARKTILLVEDERVLRESVAELLGDEGYEVLQAGDGKVACEMILQRPVDLVISDVRMPALDGMALLDYLRKTRTHIANVRASTGEIRLTRWLRIQHFILMVTFVQIGRAHV